MKYKFFCGDYIVILVEVVFFITFRNFIIKFQILYFISWHTKNNLSKQVIIFEHCKFYIKNPLSHSLKMALGRKPKHVAVMMF